MACFIPTLNILKLLNLGYKSHALQLIRNMSKIVFQSDQSLGLDQCYKFRRRSSTTLKECVRGDYVPYRQYEHRQYRLSRNQKMLHIQNQVNHQWLCLDTSCENVEVFINGKAKSLPLFLYLSLKPSEIFLGCQACS